MKVKSQAQLRPTYITLTGVDDFTDLRAVAALSNRYPLVEWGFLYSPKRQGRGGRYPSIETLGNAFQTLPKNVRVALHVCGAGVSRLLAGEPVVTGLVDSVAGRGGRLQLNFSQADDRIDLDAISGLLDRFPSLRVITQQNESNEGVWKRLCGHANYVVLFDSSGGRGVERSAWPAPLPGIHCGYAGGLGPDNLWTELPRIIAAAGGHPYWLDMEGKLRTKDDVFDLQRAEVCLREITAYQFRPESAMLASGEVVLTRAESTAAVAFHLERVQAVDAGLVHRLHSLLGNIEVDLDAPLVADDE